MTTPVDDPIAVFITAPNNEEASQLATTLVEKHLAACVQIMPRMQSVYRWQGKIERQQEILLIIKTVKANFAELEREVRSLHSYETPEIVAVPLTAVSEPYLNWLKASLNAE
jgi:periplasmic divalent cation tolerance protein